MSTKSQNNPAEHPNKPKRPMSSYMLWLSDNRGEIKAKNPGFNMIQVVKKGGELWRACELEEKKLYNDKAASLKIEYDKQIREYNETGTTDENSESTESANTLVNNATKKKKNMTATVDSKQKKKQKVKQTTSEPINVENDESNGSESEYNDKAASLKKLENDKPIGEYNGTGTIDEKSENTASTNTLVNNATKKKKNTTATKQKAKQTTSELTNVENDEINGSESEYIDKTASLKLEHDKPIREYNGMGTIDEKSENAASANTLVNNATKKKKNMTAAVTSKQKTKQKAKQTTSKSTNVENDD